ncbi:MAG: NADH-quinone oxidoreductase subunit H [Bacteroidetes bacterium]|nr:NADH-quinone oxidoreductase subunit H [Bacteroidota bacterium]
MPSFVLIIFASLFFPGIIIRTKSIASGRKGPEIFQPLKDIFRLLKKGAVYSKTSSIIFQIAPAIYFSSVLAAILVVPFGNHKGIISFEGDFLFFIYILALGKFFMIVSSLDTGSSFEGMGASREALYSMLAEPALFILIGCFAMMTGKISFADLFSSLHFGSYISYAIGVLGTYMLVMLAMVENSRMPVDDPKTHLELTMIHEVMILDNSGFDLGLILFTGNLKFAMYGALIANFFFGGFPIHIDILIFAATQIAFAIIIGLIESFMARFRMNHNPQFIFTLSSVALLIFIGILLMKNNLL